MLSRGGTELGDVQKRPPAGGRDGGGSDVSDAALAQTVAKELTDE